MLSRRNLLTGVAAAATLAMPDKKSAAAIPYSMDNRSVTWSRVVVHGGGFMMGFSIANDGTIIMRTDIAGIFKLVGGTFVSLNTPDRLDYGPFVFKGYRALWGVSAAEIAPSNSNIIYTFVQDKDFNNRQGGVYLYKSTDGGATLSPTSYPINFALSLAAFDMLTLGGANAGGSVTYKRINKRIGIDPVNPNVVYVTNPADSVSPTNIALVSFDGGATFNNVPNLPTGTLGTPGACCWQFDRSSGTTPVNGQTVTKTIFVCVSGSGTWQSTNGGVSFSQISATVGASDPQYSAISSDGVFYISNKNGTSYSLDRYQSGVWTQLLTIASSPGYTVSIAAHPTSPGVLVGMRTTNNSPHLYYWTNYGGKLTAIRKAAETYTAPTIPWWANQLTGFDMASAGLLFDPANPNDLYACVGQGACKTTLSGSPPAFPGNAPTWTGNSIGVENVVCDDLIHESGTSLLQVTADLVGFVRPTNALGTAPNNPIFGPFIRGSGWSGAIDPQSTQRWAIASEDLAYSGYSTNGGTSWANFATKPFPNIGSSVPGEIMINNGVILWLSDCAASGIDATYSFWARTTIADGGANWRILNEQSNPGCITGAVIPFGSGVFPGWGAATQSVPGHTGCADRVDPATFYIYNQNYIRPSVSSATLMTSNNPGVVTFPSSGLYIGAPVVFTTTGSLPSSVTPGQTYYVKTTPTGSTFTFSATPGGAAIDTRAGVQSGVHTCTTSPIKGIYRSTDAGMTFNYLGVNSDPMKFGIIVRHLKCAPGTNGTLFAATGYNSGATHPVGNNPFKKSINGGATWTTVPNMLEVNAFGFGKAGPSGNPTLFVAGFYKNVYGVYLSQDLGGTWSQFMSSTYGRWPLRNDAVQCLEGDKDVFGRCYVGFRGSGTVYSTLV